MSAEERRDEDLRRFEAELARLVPRRDRLDQGWRSFLAKQASFNAPAAVGLADRNQRALCGGQSGHLFVCAYCGVSGPGARGVRRWAWPAAFSAMTTVAASLLVLMVVGRDSPLVQRGPADPLPVPSPRATQAPPSRQQLAAPSSEQSPPRLDGSRPAESDIARERALVPYRGPRWNEQRLAWLAASDFELFNQVLAASFQHAATGNSTARADGEMAAGPLSSRELLDQLMDQLGPYDFGSGPAARMPYDSGARL